MEEVGKNMVLKTWRTNAVELTGDTPFAIASANTGSLASSSTYNSTSTTDIHCDAYVKVDVNGTTYYIPLYNSTA